MQLITHDKILTKLRALAKSDYWQSIYQLSKETNGLNLFYNTCDFTTLQVSFLNEISFYSLLSFDISMGEVDSIVLDNTTYEDAYYYYRANKKNKERKKSGNYSQSVAPSVTKTDKNQKEEILNKNQWVFTKVKGSSK